MKSNFEIYTYGLPSYDDMSVVDKRALLLPLIETIKDWYKIPDNRQKYEKWLSSQNDLQEKKNVA